jgi:sulfate transport system substrate-binding protein
LGNRNVNRMGYGAMQLAGPGVFGPPKDRHAALAVLREAVARGVNHIDTSDYYGPHVTNQLIREALHPYPDDLVIVTKVGAVRGADASWIAALTPADLTRAVHDNLRNRWDDLIKPGVQVITPNPKTSGGARWNYLAAWAYADAKYGHDEGKNREFVGNLYAHVPVLDTGARGSTTTFVQRGLGDVLLAWENEAFLALREFGDDKFDIVVPSLSIKAEPPVAIVDVNVDAKGTRKVAEAYLNFLYSPEAQKLIAHNYYRPSNPAAADPTDLARFPQVKLVAIDHPLFGGWGKVQPTHFADGGVFDQIYEPSN